MCKPDEQWYNYFILSQSKLYESDSLALSLTKTNLSYSSNNNNKKDREHSKKQRKPLESIEGKKRRPTYKVMVTASRVPHGSVVKTQPAVQETEETRV